MKSVATKAIIYTGIKKHENAFETVHFGIGTGMEFLRK